MKMEDDKIKYLLFIPVNDGTLIFNILTRGLELVPCTINNIRELYDCGNEILNKLKEKMIILDESVDSDALLKYIYNTFRYRAEDKLIITDAWTYRCNFSCVYCLQQNIGVNNKELLPEERVELWSALKDIFRVKYLDVVLFGGEPFYDINYVEKLLNVATDNLPELRNIGAVTNGAFPSKNKTINLIKKYDFKYVQITLDGPEEIHNQRRIFKDSATGTWNVIQSNIRDLLENTDVNIVIHSVIDSQNWEVYGEMLDFMIKKYRKWIYSEYPRIIFNLGMESHPFGFSYHTKINIPRLKEYGKIYLHVLKEAAKRNITVIDFMGSIMCSLNKNNEVILGPDGAVYKCVSAIGLPFFRVADRKTILNSPEKFIINYSKYIEGLKPNPDCFSCKYFPVCGGGCYYNAYIENKKYDCWYPIHDIMLPEMVKILYKAEEVNFNIYKLHGWIE